MKLPLPLEIIKGRFPIITQEFGSKDNVAWYKAHGINIEAHNGMDIVIGGGQKMPQDTYGTKLVCPVPTALLTRTWFTTPMSTQGNGIEVQWSDERGTIQMLLWHASEVIRQNEYKLGETLAYIGNSGLCNPPTTTFNVYAGSHLHLGTFINGVLCNPREIFNVNEWTISNEDTSIEKDLPPFIYYINLVKEKLQGLLA